MKQRPRHWPLIALAIFLLTVGFGMMIWTSLGTSLGPRIGAMPGRLLPMGAATAIVGATMLTASGYAVFFLGVYSVMGLGFSLAEVGPSHWLPWVFVVSLLSCWPLAKRIKVYDARGRGRRRRRRRR